MQYYRLAVCSFALNRAAYLCNSKLLALVFQDLFQLLNMHSCFGDFLLGRSQLLQLSLVSNLFLGKLALQLVVLRA